MTRRRPSPVRRRHRRRGRPRLTPTVPRLGRTQPKQQAACTIREKGNDRSRRLLRPSGYVRDKLDFYIENQQCLDSLLDEETDWPEPILDPARGSGNIVRPCQARGLKAVGTDIAARGFGWEERDFLHDKPIGRPGAIICNPPYKTAVKFIKRALELNVPKVAMLVGDKFRYTQELGHYFEIIHRLQSTSYAVGQAPDRRQDRSRETEGEPLSDDRPARERVSRRRPYLCQIRRCSSTVYWRWHGLRTTDLLPIWTGRSDIWCRPSVTTPCCTESWWTMRSSA